jgi:hypothetical protein
MKDERKMEEKSHMDKREEEERRRRLRSMKGS